MSGDPIDPEPGEQVESPAGPADQARDYLLEQLRAARSAAVQAGTDPDAVTADLAERLRRLRAELRTQPHADP